MPDTEGLIRRNHKGQFIAGNISRNGGRPIGERQGLSDAFIRDLRKQWDKSGSRILELLAKKQPLDFAKLVSRLLPREMAIQAETRSLRVVAIRMIGVDKDDDDETDVHNPITLDQQKPALQLPNSSEPIEDGVILSENDEKGEKR